jgi:ubiquitin carboxyl-terminal hydrolase 34
MASSDDEDEEGTHDKDMKLDDASDADENFEYKLVGVVVHMGTADAGHYISYININRGTKSEDNPEWLKTENDKWLEFNDSLVKDWK